jgi:hypothetical protein
VGGKGGGGGSGEKWPKPCMHLWIIKKKRKKSKLRVGFFEKTNKISKTISKLARIGRENSQITKIINEKEDSTIDIMK